MSSAPNTPLPSAEQNRRPLTPLLWLLRSPDDVLPESRNDRLRWLGRRAARTLLPGVGFVVAVILVGFYLPSYTLPNNQAIQFGDALYPFSRNLRTRLDVLLVLGLGAALVINWGILGFAQRKDFPRLLALLLAFVLGVVPLAVGFQMVERAYIGEPLNSMMGLIASQGVFDTELWFGALGWVVVLVIPHLLLRNIWLRFIISALGLVIVIFLVSPYMGLGYRYIPEQLTYPHTLAQAIFGILFGLPVAISLLLAQRFFPQAGQRGDVPLTK